MGTCVFFGHRDAPWSVSEPLRVLLKDWVEHEGVTQFYVGNQGTFDRIVLHVLRQLKNEYPHISYAVVLAYLPQKGVAENTAETLFPEGLERVPPRYAIDRRNRFMLKRAERVVVYVSHSHGGAARYAALAKRQNKIVHNLAETI